LPLEHAQSFFGLDRSGPQRFASYIVDVLLKLSCNCEGRSVLLQIGRGVDHCEIKDISGFDNSQRRHLAFELAASFEAVGVFRLDLARELQFPVLSALIFTLNSDVMADRSLFIQSDLVKLYVLFKTVAPNCQTSVFSKLDIDSRRSFSHKRQQLFIREVSLMATVLR
jgi:hypothetical protein